MIESSPEYPPRIFQELDDFFETPGRSLLIKGEAGTGKTTLALTLVEYITSRRHSKPAKKDAQTAVYVSSRVPEDFIKRQFPWVAFVNGHFKDTRLASAAMFVEELAGALRKETQVVVLDSWDAFAKETDYITRVKTEKALHAMAATSKSNLVFVAEEAASSTLDYLVDGIVQLSLQEVEGRTIRVCAFRKLRSAKIVFPFSVYTLSGAKFYQFKRFREPDFSRAAPIEPIGDFHGRYSLGTGQLDRVFGGIPYGASVVVEYTSEVPDSAVWLTSTALQMNFILQGRGVLLVPPLSSSRQLYREALEQGVGPERFRKLVRIFSETGKGSRQFGAPSRLDKSYFGGGITLDESIDATERALATLAKASKDGRVLGVRSMNVLESRYGADRQSLVRIIARRIGEAHVTGSPVVTLIQTDSELCSQIVGMSHMHFKLLSRFGTVFIVGVKPYTPLYEFAPDEHNPLIPSIAELV
jgi:KaiC/GvpD/RAD55 family RecA-like ATPase